MRKNNFLTILLCTVILSGCKHKEDLTVCTGVKFEEGIYNVNMDESLVVNACILPIGTTEFNNVEFEVVNDTVVEISWTDKESCSLKGLREGATVIKCSCGDFTAKAVVNVHNKESERKAEFYDNRIYMYTISSYFMDGISSECFFKKNKFDYKVENNEFIIRKENGKNFSVKLDDLIWIDMKEYEYE